MATFKILNSEFGYLYDESFQETERLVSVASKHGGVVFGGYVRDIIIPLKKLGCPLDDLDFKDLDFWFTSKEAAERFIEETGMTPGECETFDNTSGIYPICRGQHWSKYKDNNFVVCDIMISDFYPVCDFSVNLVSWDGTELRVNKPYNILSHMASIILNTETNLAEYECVVYKNWLAQEKEYRVFTLDEIIEQIQNNYYYTVKEFETIAEQSNLKHLEKVSGHARVRISKFKQKKLGSKKFV